MEMIFLIIISLFATCLCAWVRFQPSIQLSPIPIAGLLVVLSGSVLGHDFFNAPVGPIPITLDRLLLLVTLGVFGYLYLTQKEDLRPLNRLDVSILVLLGIIGLSTVTHNWRILDNMPASRLLFFNLMPVSLYWVMRTSRLQVSDLKFIAFTMALFGLYLGLTAIAEVKGLSSVIVPSYIMHSETTEFLGRGRGPFLNPVSNGIFLTTCFCFTLMWWPRCQTGGRALILTMALIMAIGVYSTLTRSTWLGLAGACALFIWLPSTQRARGMLIILATSLAILLLPIISEKVFSFKRDVNVTQNEMEKSAQMRPMFFLIAKNMFEDRPLMGCGFGQYAKAKNPYLTDPNSGVPLLITKDLMQHNVFLTYLTETGLVGLFALVLMLILMAGTSLNIWNNESLDLWARQFGLIGVVMLVCYFVNGLFHDVSIIPMQHTYMFFLLGLINNIKSNTQPFKVLSRVEATGPALFHETFATPGLHLQR